jgi:hypothetical protein
MVKAGLILLAILVVLGLVGLAPVPFLACCTGLLGLLASVGGGYMAGNFDKPVTSGLAARAGAGAGAIGGIGALLIQVIGGLWSAFAVGPEGAIAMLQQMGYDINPADINPTTFYAGAIGGACCWGLIIVAIAAGLGALGGAIWYSTRGKPTATTPAAM